MTDEAAGGDPVGSMLGHVVKAMVDHPNWVRVNHNADSSSDAYEVVVDSADLGKVIGKQGRVANALRTVAKAVAEPRDRRIYVDFTS